ncbi:MAG: hypothetical protein ACREVR_04490 [Burkholderiales bacterium]
MRTRQLFALILAAAALAAVSGPALAQGTTPSHPLLTRGGWEVGGQIARYHYEEPNFMKLTGDRIGAVGAYTFTSPDRVYSRIDLRASYGKLKYESQGTGTMDHVPDWIVEARAVIGRDYLTGDSAALSPFIGLGYRYLYNDLRGTSSTGAIGYQRYSNYVYLPLGLTARFRTGERWVVAPTVEYDVFLGGRQYSQLSDTGIGYSDASNRQRDGYGYRANLMLENGRWTFGPWLNYWNIKDSDTVPIGLGRAALEPANWTREYGVEVRYRF